MRKKLLMLFSISLIVVSCNNNEASKKIDVENAKKVESSSTKNEYPAIEFNKTVHDFGNVENGEAVFTEFELTNTGNADLIIINAFASCGCTVPEYQKTPIAPGEKSILKVRFQQSAQGQQQKTVTLVTNTQKGEELLTIKANVAPLSN